MTKFIIINAFAIALLSSCGSRPDDTNAVVPETDTTLSYYGDSIDMKDAIPIDRMLSELSGKDSLRIKVTGVIDDVCQKKGCWMTMKTSDGRGMRVSFQDYAFFVPKDVAGKTVFIEGVAYTETVSVAALRHYAEDAGTSKEEIQKINQPEITLSFEANGVIIKK